MKKKILVIALCALGCNIAFANDAKAVSGPVFGLQAGYSEATGSTPSRTYYEGGVSRGGSINYNGNVNFGGFIGYDFAVTDYLTIGPEIGINYTPNIYTNDMNLDTGSESGVRYNSLNVPIMLTGKFITPIGINAFLKGGINFQNLNAHNVTCGAGIPCASAQSQNAWTGVIAAGLGYQIDNFNIFAQYMYIFGDNASSLFGGANNQFTTTMPGKALSQSIITGGVSYTFPV